MSGVPGRTFRLQLLGIALFTLLAATVFMYFLSLSGDSLLGSGSYTLHATATDVAQMADHADVMEAGVDVGTVTGIRLSGDTAELTLSIAAKYAPVYRDGQIQIRSKTLLGEGYVDLQPGDPSSGALKSGGTLPSEAPEEIQLDNALATFTPAHRKDFQAILDDLDRGLANQGTQLNGFLGNGADLVDDAQPVTTVLAADQQQVATLIQQFGTVADSLGQRATAIQHLVTAAKTASAAVAARDTALRRTFAEAPAFIAQAAKTATKLGRFSHQATPVVGELQAATTDLLPAISELKPASAEAITVLHDLTPFAQAATATATRLRNEAPELNALSLPLESVLEQVNPMMAYLVRYSLSLATYFPSVVAPTMYHDNVGGYGRVAVVLSPGVLAGVSTAETQLLQALAKAGVLSVLAKTGDNPYPAPGTAGHRTQFAGKYPRVQANKPYTFKP